MYFGSVRFFKHLIVTVIFVVIAALTVSTIILASEDGKKQDKIEALETKQTTMQVLLDYYDGSKMPTIDEVYNMLDYFGVTPREFVNYIYDNNYTAFEDVARQMEASLVPDEAGVVPVELQGNEADFSESDVTTAATSPEDTSAEITTAASSVSMTKAETTAPIMTSTEAASEETSAIIEAADTAATTATTAESSAKSAYADLFPELYSDAVIPTNYADDSGYIYMTFDDGPTKYTNDILNYLRTYDIKATFFVVPEDCEACSEHLNEIIEDGHTIGVHSASHVYTDIYASVEAYLTDFKAAYDLIYQQTGVKPVLYRFPGGSINDYNGAVRDEIIAEMSRRGFIYFDWNVDSRDAMGATWTEMYNTVLQEVADADRAVILMHDRPGGLNTVLVLEDIIKALKGDPKNYKFAALTEKVRPLQF